MCCSDLPRLRRGAVGLEGAARRAINTASVRKAAK